MAFEKVSKSPVKDSQTAQSSSGFTSRPFAPLVKQITQIPTVQLSNSDQTEQQQEFVNKDLETKRRTKLLEIPIFPPHYNREPQRIQRKLIIGQAGDKYEQEADRVAHQVGQHLNTIFSQSVSTIQPKSEFAQRMKGKVLQRAASSGQIEMQTNKFGLMQEPKVPFIQGEGLYEDQKISQIQPKVIQRITDTEARENLSKDWLEYYDAWLEMTEAKSEESLNVLLGNLTIEELESKLQDYKNRLENEDKPENKWEYFLPDIIPFANQIDNLLANSKEFGQYIQQRQAEGINSAENVKVLGENEYLEAVVKEFKAGYDSGKKLFNQEVNTRLGELKSADESSFYSYLKVNVAKFIETGTEGLTSLFFGQSNRTIYLRKSTLSNITELYIHELMHRYSNLKILVLGNSINEGLSELFKRKFLVSLGFPIVYRVYAKEVELVEKLIEVFFNNDSTMFKQAYFQGNVEPVISKISMELRPEEYQILIKGRNVQEKITILILQQMRGEKENDEEIEKSETHDLTSKETEQEADEEIEESEIDDLTSEEGEQEANEQIEAEASQTNEPASEEGEQEADEQVEVPRAAKRKREEEEEEDDKDEIESQRRATKSRKIEE